MSAYPKDRYTGYTKDLTVVQLKQLISKYNLRNAMPKGYTRAKRSELLSMISKAGYKPSQDPKKPALIPISSMKRKIVIK